MSLQADFQSSVSLFVESGQAGPLPVLLGLQLPVSCSLILPLPHNTALILQDRGGRSVPFNAHFGSQDPKWAGIYLSIYLSS